MFGLRRKKKPDKPVFTLREGVSSVWFYHIAEDEEPLCGEYRLKTMETSIPLDTWGMKTHINEKYCKECDRIARERGLVE